MENSPQVSDKSKMIQYETVDFAVQSMISDRMRHFQYTDPRFQNMVIHQFKIRVLGRKVRSISYPKTWQDAVLDRWMPQSWRFTRPRWFRWVPANWWDKFMPNYTVVTAQAFYLGLNPDEVGSSEVETLKAVDLSQLTDEVSA